jgi:ribose transport system substrate-binding protein
MFAATGPRKGVDMASSRPVRGWASASVRLSVPVAAAVLLASCSSSSSTSSSSSASSSAPASSGGSSQVSAAQQKVTAAQAVPSAILQTTPLTSRPAPGKTIIWLKCELSQCADIGSGAAAAAQALGWKYEAINWTSSDPTTLISAMGQALQQHPYAVGFSGTPEAVWQSQIPAFVKAGVKLIPVVTGPLSVQSPVIPTEIGDFTSAGESLGDWMIADSGGTGNALLVDTPAFPILTGIVTGAQEAISAGCPGCKTTSLNGTLAEVTGGQFVPAIVTVLRKDPSIKYVIDSDLLFITGLSSALKAAGITGVKITGGQPEPADLSAIQSGTEAAAALNNNVLLGWVVVDALARASEGMAVPPGDGGVPIQLLTKSNISSTDLNTYAAPTNYQQLFMTLWKVL